MAEEWRSVVGYEGSYEVSSNGRVRSVDREIRLDNGQVRHLQGRDLAGFRGQQGYWYADLYQSQIRRKFKVHALVAAAFIGPRPTGYDVCHNNGDNQDNRPQNLRYGTRSENIRDLVSHGKHHLASKTHCLRGHELSEENVYVNRSAGYASRQCRVCRRELREVNRGNERRRQTNE